MSAVVHADAERRDLPGQLDLGVVDLEHELPEAMPAMLRHPVPHVAGEELVRRVAELPVVGGNPFYLARLSPGVLSAGGRSAGNPMDNGAATGVIVNGTRGGSSEVTVDGIPNMTNRNAVFSPPQDLVQEFRIQTATYDATIGHAAGAMTNVSMRAGANALHGTL